MEVDDDRLDHDAGRAAALFLLALGAEKTGKRPVHSQGECPPACSRNHARRSSERLAARLHRLRRPQVIRVGAVDLLYLQKLNHDWAVPECSDDLLFYFKRLRPMTRPRDYVIAVVLLASSFTSWPSRAERTDAEKELRAVVQR